MERRKLNPLTEMVDSVIQLIEADPMGWSVSYNSNAASFTHRSSGIYVYDCLGHWLSILLLGCPRIVTNTMTVESGFRDGLKIKKAFNALLVKRPELQEENRMRSIAKAIRKAGQ